MHSTGMTLGPMQVDEINTILVGIGSTMEALETKINSVVVDHILLQDSHRNMADWVRKFEAAKVDLAHVTTGHEFAIIDLLWWEWQDGADKDPGITLILFPYG
ncbi:hypothetical protein NDU88_002953 [Pleurodeles waltl]|uniref:Uncharacterized protein n=1 Tax=Pleurodeles waltl TaxID=8319 RepID=A0AAV7RBH4_PLEWA|nr:hypothetical protein NDU88_002953 [Pleurodeles waltl]